MTTCKGMTSDGDHCKRPVKDGEEYCWQHKLSVKSDKENTSPSDLGRQEAKLNKRGLTVPKWLREAVIGNIISTILMESALKVGRVLMEILKQDRDNEKDIELPLMPMQKEAPTPPCPHVKPATVAWKHCSVSWMQASAAQISMN